MKVRDTEIMDGLAVQDKSLNFLIKSWPKPSSQSWSLLDITVLLGHRQLTQQ